MATGKSVFDDLAWFPFVTCRAALETPPDHYHYPLPQTHPFEAYILAAAVWIEIVGVQMYYEWGVSGKGGPLRKGGQGFCKERRRFWREKFGEVARSSIEGGLGGEMKMATKEAGLMMREVGEGNVEEYRVDRQAFRPNRFLH